MIELPDGRQRSTGIPATDENRANAEEAYARIIAGLAEAKAAGRSTRKRTVANYFEQWIATRHELQKKGKLMTAQDDDTRIRRHALPTLGAIPLRELKPKHIRELRADAKITPIV